MNQNLRHRNLSLSLPEGWKVLSTTFAVREGDSQVRPSLTISSQDGDLPSFEAIGDLNSLLAKFLTTENQWNEDAATRV